MTTSAEQLKAADVMPTPDQATNQILGYGKVMTILIGKDDDGKDITKSYHLTPVSLRDIPKLMELVNKFMMEFSAEGQEFSESSLEAIAETIHMSTKRMHPDTNKDEILANFSLGSLAEAIEIVMDMNDFLSKMTAVNQKMSQMAKK